jgi:hypothetical protein
VQVRKSEPKNRPPPLPGIVRITRQAAASGQTDSAIQLWFESGDITSIHTLAVAAQGVLSALSADMGKPLSKVLNWINEQPKSFQSQLRNPQNFFKHGHHKQPYRDVVSFIPGLAEMILIDNISTYQGLFDSLTPLMKLFAIRFSIEHPDILPLKLTLKGFEIEDLARLTRSQFLKEILPFCS